MTKLARSLLSLSASACRVYSELEISHTILYSHPMIASESYSQIGINLPPQRPLLLDEGV